MLGAVALGATGMLLGPLAAPGTAARVAEAGKPAAAGTGWAVQPTSNAVIANGVLAADACVSPGDCVAVGSYEGSAGSFPLAEAWHGAAWQLMKIPAPPRATRTALDGVSCTAATACTAVGSYTNNMGTQVTLAERWDGTAWSVQATPSPASATSSILTSVSCADATLCTGVGYYNSGPNAQVRLVEQWDGTRWAIRQASNPPGGVLGSLAGVSCPSPTACIAVGQYLSLRLDDSLTLAEAWNGSTWTVVRAANPADSIVNRLNGVSCSSPTSCTAVGDTISDATRRSAGSPARPLAATLAESWNGTAWTIQPTPNPAGTIGIDTLTSVSCQSAGSCTAVGYAAGIVNGAKALAEGWNGTAWAIQAAPDPGRLYRSLAGVSCGAAGACAAVGNYRDGAGTHLALAEAWNGATWAVQPAPNPVGAVPSVLVGVSCGSATSCTGVGFFDNSQGTSRTLAEAWHGSTWVIQRTPDPARPAHASLASVSCSSSSTCVAVGRSYGKKAGSALAESWNGTSWVIQPTPAPPGTFGRLLGVSCTSATGCTAVGWYEDSSLSALPLAESWNGTAWTIQPVPSPPGGYEVTLNSVSCTSPVACTAVGSYTSGGSVVALAERWDGTAWTVQPAPAGDDNLYGVWCTSATACTAVGDSFSSSAGVATLAEAWRNGIWRVQRTPHLPGFFSILYGVTCRTAGDCTAVGGYHSGSGVALTLAESWSGTAWAVQPSANPRFGADDVLAGVSCRSPLACTAVGSLASPPAQVSVTLAEARGG